MFLGSDALALAPLTDRICYLSEGDYAVLTHGGATVYDKDDRPVERAIRRTALSGAMIGKGEHRHFMHKEIYEQPQVIGDTLNSMLNPADQTITLTALPFSLSRSSGSPSSPAAPPTMPALVAKYWLEQIARVPVDVDIASEFRYRTPPMAPGGLALFISQSGETADTLAALRYCRAQGQHILSLVNVAEIDDRRESDAVLQTMAGPEIGVASTKAFTTQLTVLACVSLCLARARGAIDHAEEARLSQALAEVPARAAEVLAHDERLRVHRRRGVESPRRVVPRTRQQLSDRPGRCAEA